MQAQMCVTPKPCYFTALYLEGKKLQKMMQTSHSRWGGREGLVTDNTIAAGVDEENQDSVSQGVKEVKNTEKLWLQPLGRGWREFSPRYKKV